MATKMSMRKEYLEYIVIRPAGGLSIDQIGTAILMWYKDDFDYRNQKIIKHNLKQFFYKHNTWNKIMSKVKDIIYDEGMIKLDYAWENIEHFDTQLATVRNFLQKINPLIGTKKK